MPIGWRDELRPLARAYAREAATTAAVLEATMTLKARISRLEAQRAPDTRPQPSAAPDHPIFAALAERGLIRWEAGGWIALAPLPEVERAYLAELGRRP